MAMKGIVHMNGSTEKKSRVRDFREGRMEPAPELPVKSRTRALALKKRGK